MKLIREQKRVQVVTLKNEGLKNKEVAKKTGLSVSGIQKIMRTVKKTNSFKERPRSGRPSKLTDRNKRKILNILKMKEATSAISISKVLKRYHDVDVSSDTIFRVLKSFGYACRVKRKTVVWRKPRLQ